MITGTTKLKIEALMATAFSPLATTGLPVPKVALVENRRSKPVPT